MFEHICDYCGLRLSLGKTPFGWLPCIVCQSKTDRAIREFSDRKFPASPQKPKKERK